MYNILAREQVQAGEHRLIEKEFHAAGIVQDLSLRFYPGQMLDLEIEIRIERLGGSEVQLFNFMSHGSKTIAGDDDYFKEAIGISVRRKEKLQIYVYNKSTVPVGGNASDYVYDFVVHTSIKEEGDL